MISTESENLQAIKAARGKYERNAKQIGIILLIACFLASVVIQLSGAVTTEGTIIRQGENIMLQHSNGGLVEQIHVKNGDKVKTGDLLITLDGSDTHSEYNRLTRSKLELSLQIKRARAALAGKTTLGEEATANIEAEISKFTIRKEHSFLQHAKGTVDNNNSDASAFALRVGVFAVNAEANNAKEQSSLIEDPNNEFGHLKQIQEKALQAEQELIAAQINQVQQRIHASLGAKKELSRQIATNKARLSLVHREISELQDLAADKLVSRSRVTSLEREKLETRQRLEALELEQKRHANEAISGQAEIKRIKSEQVSSLWNLIQTNEQRLGEITHQLESVKARRERLEIFANSSGRVHEMAVSNTGSVIRPGENVLQIVPENGAIQVKVRIQPVNIDDVAVNQFARLRFDTFKEFASEELQGKIVGIAPDRSIDEQTGQPFYSATIALNEDSIKLLRTISPEIGSPITVMIETKKQSLARYLLAPALTAVERTFSEG